MPHQWRWVKDRPARTYSRCFMEKNMLFAILAACCPVFGLKAQLPDSTAVKALHEVTITGVHEAPSRENVLPVSVLHRDQMLRAGAETLCNALTQIPGVSRLSTGSGIAKPVIRGLYGNRVLVLLGSLKFDNQQWQDEHGLGLPAFGVGRVEVIKGPASVLYGSEAVGGVVNIIEERPDPGLHCQGDAGLQYFSNTGGLSADAGLAGNTARGWWRVRAGVENHADYSDGSGTRVLNSRFNGYHLYATLARQNARRQSVFSVQSNWSNFGFILEDLSSFFEPDRRWSRSLSGPHHSVLLHVFSVQNTFFRPDATLKFNAGLQSNLRLEDEGGGAISLNMHLVSLPYNLQWIKPLNSHNELIVSNIGALENNTNYGARIIVPDANLLEEGLSVFWRHKSGAFLLETGAGLADKFIETFATRNLNTPGKEIQPFRRNRAAANGLLGVVWNPSDRWNLKVHAATGFRAPNLAELSSNGLHEGIFRYEIGDPNLHNEQNLNLETEFNFTGRFVSAGAAAFLNQFFRYIYLAPTGEDYFGFPVFRYRQDDARLYGGEAYAALHANGWRWGHSLALVRGLRRDGTNLPFIPAVKYANRLEWSGAFGKRWPKAWGYVEGEQNFRQFRPSEYETATPGYFLLHAGFGGVYDAGKYQLTVGLVGRNLLDKRYFDHLSRFKAYGIYNPGRDVSLSVRIGFGH